MHFKKKSRSMHREHMHWYLCVRSKRSETKWFQIRKIWFSSFSILPASSPDCQRVCVCVCDCEITLNFVADTWAIYGSIYAFKLMNWIHIFKTVRLNAAAYLLACKSNIEIFRITIDWLHCIDVWILHYHVTIIICCGSVTYTALVHAHYMWPINIEMFIFILILMWRIMLCIKFNFAFRMLRNRSLINNCLKF